LTSLKLIMKTNRPHFDLFCLNKLKLELFNKIGWTISNKPDCVKLSEIIAQSGHGQLSDSTIYRLFFRFEEHRPYKHTLDILCKFLSFNDSVDFIQKLEVNRKKLHVNGINTIKNKNHSLLFYCIEHTSKKALSDFLDLANESDQQFKKDLSLEILRSLIKSKKQTWFLKNFAEKKYVKEYLMDLKHDLKFQIKNYDKVHSNYLEQIKNQKNALQTPDYLMGKCDLFRHYIKSNLQNKALKVGKELYTSNLCSEDELIHFNSLPFFRYGIYKLWYLDLARVNYIEKERYAFSLITCCKEYKEKLNYQEQKILFYYLAETFIQSSLPENFHFEVKKLFKEFFNLLPENIYSKHLKYSLPYFVEDFNYPA
jgi:hypothetical protein